MWPPLIQFLTNSIPSSPWINFSVTYQGWTFQSLLTRPICTNPPMVLAEMLQFRPDTSRVQPASGIDAPALTLVLRRHLLINTWHGTLALTSANTCIWKKMLGASSGYVSTTWKVEDQHTTTSKLWLYCCSRLSRTHCFRSTWATQKIEKPVKETPRIAK